MKKRLVALLIGINDYSGGIRPLEGAVNDASAMADYLENSIDRDLFDFDKQRDLVLLLNEQATYNTIIQHFLTHLGQAQEGDVALFYFAGHGSQELTHPLFQNSAHAGVLETLVCFDSRQPAGFDLCDKELRYLIHRVAATHPHLIVITDNCHSGSATRDLTTNTDEEEVVFRNGGVDTARPARAWEEFLFARMDAGQSGDLKSEADFNTAFPEGAHIHLAACSHNELAAEERVKDGMTRGIFTYNLLKSLQQAKGLVTYQDLEQRMRGIVGGGHLQSPNLYLPLANKADRLRGFLGGAVATQTDIAHCTFSNHKEPALRGWYVDRGAFHGVPISSDPAIKLAVTVDDDSGRVYEANVKSVEAARMKVIFETDAPPQDVIGRVKMPTFYPLTLQVWIDTSSVPLQLFEELKQVGGMNEKRILNMLLVFTDEESTAEYVIRASHQSLYLTRKFENTPLALQSYGMNTGSAAVILQQLEKIWNWEFISRLEQDKSEFSPNPPIALTIVNTAKGIEEQLIPVNHTISTDFSNTSLKITIKNISAQPLYVGALELAPLFGIENRCITGEVIKLNPKEEVHFLDGDPINYTEKPYMTTFGLKEIVYYYKFLVNTASFGSELLAQPKLPAPVRFEDLGKSSEEFQRDNSRDIGDARSNSIVKQTWTSVLLRLVMKRS